MRIDFGLCDCLVVCVGLSCPSVMTEDSPPLTGDLIAVSSRHHQLQRCQVRRPPTQSIIILWIAVYVGKVSLFVTPREGSIVHKSALNPRSLSYRRPDPLGYQKEKNRMQKALNPVLLRIPFGIAVGEPNGWLKLGLQIASLPKTPIRQYSKHSSKSSIRCAD